MACARGPAWAPRWACPPPVIDAVVALGLTVLSEPMDTNRRTLADLGIDGLTGDEIRAYVAGDPA